MDRIKSLENKAAKKFGYNKERWILQDIFSNKTYDLEQLKKREETYREFLFSEFVKFEEKWRDFLSEKEKEIKASYQNAFQELLEGLKTSEYEWLKK